MDDDDEPALQAADLSATSLAAGRTTIPMTGASTSQQGPFVLRRARENDSIHRGGVRRCGSGCCSTRSVVRDTIRTSSSTTGLACRSSCAERHSSLSVTCLDAEDLGRSS